MECFVAAFRSDRCRCTINRNSVVNAKNSVILCIRSIHQFLDYHVITCYVVKLVFGAMISLVEIFSLSSLLTTHAKHLNTHIYSNMHAHNNVFLLHLCFIRSLCSTFNTVRLFNRKPYDCSDRCICILYMVASPNIFM